MKKTIIGREPEIKKLKNYMASTRSEFIVIYGRRRVGKTFLVKELFHENFTFMLTGRENATTEQQLTQFAYALDDYFGNSTVPVSWSEAFRMLSKAIEQQPEGTKIIFIDELPWLDTSRSDFIIALELFWNNWAYYRSDIKLITCGSATSWMLNNIINSRGGLHNRATHSMLISPFSLKETEQYFKYKGFNYSRLEVLDCYMAVGGVAYYLSLFDKDKSVAQNIDALCFTRGGELTNEFSKIYKSLFKKADKHILIVSTLSHIGKGLTRTALIGKTGFANNGKLSRMLQELEMCEFIRSYIPFGKKKKDTLYQLTDQFSLFHLHFKKGNSNSGKNFWIKNIGTGAYNAWAGYAFETVCLHHIDQLMDGLGISGMINKPCSWYYSPSASIRNDEEADDDLKTGAQIDLLIDRKDKTITVCEMKYANGEYEITKAYDKRVQDRIRTFKKVTKTSKSVVLTYITPQGLHDNMYARKLREQITAETLFR